MKQHILVILILMLLSSCSKKHIQDSQQSVGIEQGIYKGNYNEVPEVLSPSQMPQSIAGVRIKIVRESDNVIALSPVSGGGKINEFTMKYIATVGSGNSAVYQYSVPKQTVGGVTIEGFLTPNAGYDCSYIIAYKQISFTINIDKPYPVTVSFSGILE